MNKMAHHNLTEKIIRCALEVHTTLGSGFLEKVYENALLMELSTMGVDVVSQEVIQVLYKGSIVGDYIADIMVDRKVIVELKAVEKLTDIHEIQLKNYLKATGIEVGLLLNYGKSLDVKRKYVPNSESERRF